jgi:hypothetical protein
LSQVFQRLSNLLAQLEARYFVKDFFLRRDRTLQVSEFSQVEQLGMQDPDGVGGLELDGVVKGLQEELVDLVLGELVVVA